MCECVCYCAYCYYVNKLYVHVCVLERAKHSFFALPNPLSCSVMNKICLNQIIPWLLLSVFYDINCSPGCYSRKSNLLLYPSSDYPAVSVSLFHSHPDKILPVSRFIRKSVTVS